jgi:hypothetical protein
MSALKPVFSGFSELKTVAKEIICGWFGTSGNGLFTAFQEIWVAVKCA